MIKEIKFPVELGFGLAHTSQYAQRSVAPKWGQIINIKYVHLPQQQNISGEIYALSSNFFFPGILKSHSFSAGFNYQKTNGAYRFNNEIPEVYGYNQFEATGPLKNTLLINYRFPFAFPDAELGGFAYVRNLRAGLFAHYENLDVETTLKQPKTFGIELRSSMHLLRFLPVADVGARIIFVNKTYHQQPLAEFIFNYTL